MLFFFSSEMIKMRLKRNTNLIYVNENIKFKYMISNDKLLETYNYLKGVYMPPTKSVKDCEAVFRSMLQEETYKQYNKPTEVSFDLITDLLLGYTLNVMINAKENYNTVHFEYYFSYSFARYNSGKKDMEVKLAIFSDKLMSYGIDKFVVEYRYLADSSIRKFGVNLEVLYDNGFKLEDIEKGHCLFQKVEE